MTAVIIDDLSKPFPRAANGASWEMLSDRVMGGVSAGTLTRESVAGRDALRMRGMVSLENNGGFIQMALDLSPDGATVDASGFEGLEVTILGADETYGIHLRTADLARPWQSYRQSVLAVREWQLIRLPFSGFAPYRTEVPLDLRKLRRVGLVAIGRAFTADLALADIRFY